MADVALKLVSSVGALLGALIIIMSVGLMVQGRIPEVGAGALAFKAVLTAMRVALLFLCAWAAWREPRLAPWFAWGSMIAFAVAGAGDEILAHGFGALRNMIPAYYFGVALHAVFATVIWMLSHAVGRS